MGEKNAPGGKIGRGADERDWGAGEWASRRAALNGVARDSPGLVSQGVGVLTSAIAARVESKQVNGGGLRQVAAAWPFGRYRRYPALPGTERN